MKYPELMQGLCWDGVRVGRAEFSAALSPGSQHKQCWQVRLRSSWGQPMTLQGRARRSGKGKEAVWKRKSCWTPALDFHGRQSPGQGPGVFRLQGSEHPTSICLSCPGCREPPVLARAELTRALFVPSQEHFQSKECSLGVLYSNLSVFIPLQESQQFCQGKVEIPPSFH